MKNKAILILCLVALIAVFGFSFCDEDKSKSEPVIYGTPDDPVTDIEGNTYKTVKIGDKVWMAENFRSSRSQTGQDIQDVYVYNNDDNYLIDYGRLYTWPAAVKATPDGWHLPTKQEWEELINLVGGAHIAGGKLKETGTAHWDSPNSGATNTVGFTALAGGFRAPNEIYYDLHKHGSYWGTANNAQDPYCVYIYNLTANIVTEVSPIDKTSGIAFAVRYVKNQL